MEANAINIVELWRYLFAGLLCLDSVSYRVASYVVRTQYPPNGDWHPIVQDLCHLYHSPIPTQNIAHSFLNDPKFWSYLEKEDDRTIVATYISQLLKIKPFGLELQSIILEKAILVPETCKHLVKQFELVLKRAHIQKEVIKLLPGEFLTKLTEYKENIFHSFDYQRVCRHPLAQGPTVIRKPFHFTFVVDESGSMSSGDAKPTLQQVAKQFNNRYGAVIQVCVNFTQGRIQNTDDIYSFTCHDNDLRKIFVEQSVMATPQNPETLEQQFLKNNPRFRGNNFELVFTQLYSVVSSYESVKKQSHVQVIAFIGDGGDKFADKSKALNKLVAELKCTVYAVMIGKDAYGIECLKSIAKIASDSSEDGSGGSFMYADLNFKEIERVFNQISSKFT